MEVSKLQPLVNHKKKYFRKEKFMSGPLSLPKVVITVVFLSFKTYALVYCCNRAITYRLIWFSNRKKKWYYGQPFNWRCNSNLGQNATFHFCFECVKVLVAINYSFILQMQHIEYLFFLLGCIYKKIFK